MVYARNDTFIEERGLAQLCPDEVAAFNVVFEMFDAYEKNSYDVVQWLNGDYCDDDMASWEDSGYTEAEIAAFCAAADSAYERLQRVFGHKTNGLGLLCAYVDPDRVERYMEATEFQWAVTGTHQPTPEYKRLREELGLDYALCQYTYAIDEQY